MESVYRDFIHSLKCFSRSPIFACVFVIALAVGIGADISVFSVVDALVLRPLPLPHPEELVDISGNYRKHSRTPISYPMFTELERGQRAFTGICGWTTGRESSVEIGGQISLSDVRSVTGDYYSVLETTPLLGRLINPSDVQGSKAAPVVVIGYELWKSRFGGNAAIIGKTIHIDGKLFTIVGVTQKGFTGMTLGSPPEITVPAAALLDPSDLQSRQLLWLFVTGRLASGNTIKGAAAQLQSFWPQLLLATMPTQNAGERKQSFLSMSLQVDPAATGAINSGNLRSKIQKPLNLLLGIVALILLVICVNMASLTLARAIQRRQEISTRIALGASPWQAVRQFVAETMFLSCTGALLALLLSLWGSQFLIVLMSRGQTIPALLDVTPDWRVFFYAAFTAILTGALTGVLPAWFLSRKHPGSALLHNERTIGRRAGRLGKALIISQVAISLILLESAGLFLRTLESLKSFNPGFDKVAVWEFDLSPVQQDNQPAAIDSYRRQLTESIAGLPSVKSVAFSNVPVLGADFAWKDTVSRVPDTNPADAVAASQVVVSPGFFRTLGIPLLTGRDFTWSDDKNHPRVAIIDNALAKHLFAAEDPVSKHVRFGVYPDYQDLEIIGVSRPARLLDLRDASGTFIFLASPQFGDANGTTLLVRGADVTGFRQAVEHETESFGREFSTATSTIAQRSENGMVNEKMIATLSSFFAGIGLVVAGFGLFGLLMYSVSLRSGEIGIRMAMGAQRVGILRLILREAFQVTAIGVGIGIPIALGLSRIFSSMLFALSFADPLTIATASLTLISTCLLAGLLPAIRAMSVEPMAALRHE
jgi:predicted permease